MTTLLDNLKTKDPDYLLTASEVAELFRVDKKTVTRWAGADRIRYIRTPGGHVRFRTGDVLNLLSMGEMD